MLYVNMFCNLSEFQSENSFELCIMLTVFTERDFFFVQREKIQFGSSAKGKEKHYKATKIVLSGNLFSAVKKKNQE